MTEVYQKNIAVVAKRWPELAERLNSHSVEHLAFEVIEKKCAAIVVNGVQLSSAYDPIEEVLAYRSITSGHDYHVWGFGMGNVPQVLLHDQQVRSITLYIYNLDIIKLVLSLLTTDWLNDPRIELQFVEKESSQTHRQLKHIFEHGSIVISADRTLSKQHNHLDWITHRLDHRFIGQHVSRNQFNRDAEFIEIEKQNYPLLKTLKPADHLLKSVRISEAMCIGAGPSLDAHIEQLKALYQQPTRPIFIAPSTACRALLKHGIVPDITAIVDIDIKPESIDFKKLKTSTLVFASRINKGIFEQWQGDKYYLHLFDETYDRFNQKLPTQCRFYIFGSVIHTISHLALRLGAKKISFLGTDFGFPNEIQHASTQDTYKIDMSLYVENGFGDNIKSSPTYRMFCSGIENIIAQCPNVEFINWSRMGAKIIGTKYLDEA